MKNTRSYVFASKNIFVKYNNKNGELDAHKSIYGLLS